MTSGALVATTIPDGGSEGREQPPVPVLVGGCELLGMPLHRHGPPRRVPWLEGLDDSVLAAGSYPKLASRPAHRLMMRGVGRDTPSAGDVRQPRARLDVHGVDALGPF